MGALFAFMESGVALTYVPTGSPEVNQQWVPTWPAQSYTETDGWLAWQMLASGLYSGSY